MPNGSTDWRYKSKHFSWTDNTQRGIVQRHILTRNILFRFFLIDYSICWHIMSYSILDKNGISAYYLSTPSQKTHNPRGSIWIYPVPPTHADRCIAEVGRFSWKVLEIWKKFVPLWSNCVGNHYSKKIHHKSLVEKKKSLPLRHTWIKATCLVRKRNRCSAPNWIPFSLK